MSTLVKNGVPHGSLPNPFLIQRALIDGQHTAVGSPTAETYLSRQYGFCITRAIADQRQQMISGDANAVPVDLIDRECDARYAWAQSQLDGVIHKNAAGHSGWTDHIDALLTHRFFGLISFMIIMFAIFQSIYSFASIPMDAIEGLTGWVSDSVIAMMPPGMLRSLITDGIIAGVGGVLIFLPQIAFLFLFLALLEDCGYMARAAFVVDRMMSAFGLSGKSFLPLMSSFACAVPGVMATRVIESRRDRLTTIMVAPLMSCSARLPVYLLLIGAFVPATTYLGGWMSLPAMVLMSMYMVGVVVAVPVAWILKKTILRGDAAPFVLELPEYKWPALRVVFSRVWQASIAFVVRAGTLIFAASILIWFAGYWPGDHARQFELQAQLESLEESERSDSDGYAAAKTELHRVQATLIENSVLGKTGHAIEPLVRPLGWDWKIGVGAVASFPAREVIIATLGTIYSLGGEEDGDGLISAMRASKYPDGSPVYTLPVALSVMVFFALCAQCVSTLLVIRRETNSWFWPVLSFTYMTVLAYAGAFLTFQIGSRLFSA
jgi:ferrous iron transport protein B